MYRGDLDMVTSNGICFLICLEFDTGALVVKEFPLRKFSYKNDDSCDGFV